MQDTELESMTAALAVAASTGPGHLQLVIANKNYSSWSMRPWVALTAFDIPFEEIRICLDRPDTYQQIALYSPSGRVPVLIADGHAIWDSLAICEYLAEQFPRHGMWPRDLRARATARSICAEMHASFSGLRHDMSMNIRASRPGKGRTPDAQADIGRICEIWEQCLSGFGHRGFLFGDFSIADAFYAPVVMRFLTYDVALAPALQAYVERVAEHPAVALWVAQAHAETEAIPKYDNAQ
ncbi:glutathione S-transferase family protein [Lacisediminimonas sp.]|uniref:glutathione S-transferase family protein n=1 Tax=Lacisediminimonas sp. TaxID=3060582 RepID=UPI0027265463|nr:glutathione S-transferase family protein [Lacisediminimonas sp.]MDO8299001.1 glutathione S-transferase family protein [Lacisediminimonas sp.]